MTTGPSLPGTGRRPLAPAAACLLVLLTGCGTGADQTLDDALPVAASAAVAPAPAAPGTAGVRQAPVATERIPVYWVGSAGGKERLFRELRDSAEGPAAVDPIAAAAALLTTSAPEDPRHRSHWAPAERVGSSTAPDGTITVDLPAGAFRARLDAGEARLALQQLVHTVTAAASTAGLLPQNAEPRVVVLVDGRAHEEVFGSVRLDGPLRPEEELEAPLWLVDPGQGPHPEGTVTVAGRALQRVGECRWTVTDEHGTTVSSGTAATVPQDDGTVAFRTEVDLAPGTYEVAVTGRDAEDGAVRDDGTVEVVPR